MCRSPGFSLQDVCDAFSRRSPYLGSPAHGKTTSMPCACWQAWPLAHHEKARSGPHPLLGPTLNSSSMVHTCVLMAPYLARCAQVCRRRFIGNRNSAPCTELGHQARTVVPTGRCLSGHPERLSTAGCEGCGAPQPRSQSHLEYCGSIRGVKHVYKYTYKGHDAAEFHSASSLCANQPENVKALHRGALPWHGWGRGRSTRVSYLHIYVYIYVHMPVC